MSTISPEDTTRLGIGKGNIKAFQKKPYSNALMFLTNSSGCSGSGRGSGQLLSPATTDIELLIDKNREKLLFCNTEWIALAKTYSYRNDWDFILSKNHCGQRNCNCKFCIRSRIAKAKRRIKRYFDLYDHFSHITLTTGCNKAFITKSERKEWDRKVTNFLRRLTRGKKGRKHKVLWVIECKKQGKDLYHLHYHMVFLGYCPHRATIHNVWGQVTGENCRTNTKYHANKKALLNYFAKRCAMAGDGMDPEEYISLVRGDRMFRVFGGLIGKGFLSLYNRSQLNQKDTGLPGEKPYWHFIGTYPSNKSETVPPPDLIDRVKQQFLYGF